MKRAKVEASLEKLIFASRWFQAPLYMGLIIAGLAYTYKFVMELIHLLQVTNEISEEMVMLSVLTLVDVTMVANLLIMVIIGGYATFVSRLDLSAHPDRPDWLEKIDAGTLKVKLATGLVGISGIHLLKSFIDIRERSLDSVKYQIIIHVVFLFSAIALAVTEQILHKNHDAKS